MLQKKSEGDFGDIWCFADVLIKLDIASTRESYAWLILILEFANRKVQYVARQL